MTLRDLATTLREMYENAPKGEQVTMIYLFGVKYHTEIKEFGVKQVIEQSAIHSTYHSELSKAIKLAKYLQLKTTV